MTDNFELVILIGIKFARSHVDKVSIRPTTSDSRPWVRVRHVPASKQSLCNLLVTRSEWMASLDRAVSMDQSGVELPIDRTDGAFGQIVRPPCHSLSG